MTAHSCTWVALLALCFSGCSPAATERPAKSSPAKHTAPTSPAAAAGCDSGLRDGFSDRAKYPKIAACAGSWTEAGLLTESAGKATASALCAEGWHICSSLAEVERKSSGRGCAGAGLEGEAFFATLEGATHAPECFTRGAVGLLGCGKAGAPAPAACAPMDRVSNPGCSALEEPWSCQKDREIWSVSKSKHEGGGVLCCEGALPSAEKTSTQPWTFGGGTPFMGNGKAACVELSLSTTNTEPWGESAFRNVPGSNPSVVILTFSREISAFHLSVRLSGPKAYLTGFNVPPSSVTGGAKFDGKEVRASKGTADVVATLSWFKLNSDALSWVVGGKDKSTVLIEEYGLSCN